MKVTKLEIENLTVFRERRTFSFCHGINVFLGTNGTGKSHVMKAIYSILKANEQKGSGEATAALRFQNRLAAKLAGVFKPDEGGINRLISRSQGQRSASLLLDTDFGKASCQITGRNNLARVRNDLTAREKCIFLPSREALALFEGFLPLYQDQLISFDETYNDLCLALQASQVVGRKGERAKTMIKPLEEAFEGKVRLEGGRFYVTSSQGAKVEAHLLAEGWRKLASVAQLILNGSLRENGVLFWDEPEANLNPKLISVVVELLVSLAAEGIQVFVSTHDYLLSQRLSLIAEYRQRLQKDRKVTLKFFCLSRNAAMTTDVDAGDTLADLKHNPILEEFAALYDREARLVSDENAQP